MSLRFPRFFKLRDDKSVEQDSRRTVNTHMFHADSSLATPDDFAAAYFRQESGPTSTVKKEPTDLSKLNSDDDDVEEEEEPIADFLDDF